MRPPPPHMMGMRPPMPPRPPMRGMGFRRGAPPRNAIGGFKGIQRGRIMKKRRPPTAKNMDLTKEWVTDAIRLEFKQKEEMLAKAKETDNKADWATYRGQREKCSQMYHAAEMEFVGQQEVRIPQLLPATNFTRVTAPIDYTADVLL